MRSNTYILDSQYPQLFQSVGLKTDEVLRKAGLAQDLFGRSAPVVTSAEYFAFMQAISDLTSNDGLAVQLATHDGVEKFSPPVFAAYCAHDGLRCIKRLAEYKPLIGPVRYRLEELGDEVTLYLESDDIEHPLPSFFTEGELAFILHVLRNATKTAIIPLNIEVAHELSEAFREFASAPIITSGITAITFNKADLELPFISYNEGMWSFFEPELQRRLSQLAVDDSWAARVRAALVELLPAGETTIEDVARKLRTSSRTLQRQLSAEKTTFRKQLNHVRLLLAKQYLASTDMDMDSIAFMLGYLEANSFIRAFTLWTGTSPNQYRVVQ